MTFIRIIYLYIIEVYLKVIAANYYFFHSKDPSEIMKNDFYFISMYP